MALDEQKHRHAIQNCAIEADIQAEQAQFRQVRRGQILAFLISGLCVAGGVVLGLNGHPVAGTALSGGTVVALVTAFLYVRRHPAPDARP